MQLGGVVHSTKILHQKGPGENIWFETKLIIN